MNYTIIIIAALIILIILSYLLEEKKLERHGSSKFKYDFKFNRFNKGFYIDGRRLSFSQSCRHLLLIGSSGSGKTQSVIAHQIYTLARDKKYSLLVTDPKLELYHLSSGYCRSALDMEVYVLNLHQPAHSFGWNPFANITNQGIKKIVADIYDIVNTDKDSEAIWKHGSCELIEIIISILKNIEHARYLNFANIKNVLDHLQAYPKETEAWLREQVASDKLRISLERFLKSEEKIKFGWLSGAITTILPFCSESVLKISSHHSLPPINELRKKRCIIYLGMPIGLDRSYAPFITLFLSSLFSDLLKTPYLKDHFPLACIMEEFGNISAIPSYTSIVSTIRSKAILLLHCVQNLSQIYATYGVDDARTIVSNCNSIIAMSGISDKNTLEFITEDLLGSTTITSPPFSARGKEFGRQLILKDELRRMDIETGLLIVGNKQPIKLRFSPLYKNLIKKLQYRLSSRHKQLISKYPPYTHHELVDEPELIEIIHKRESQGNLDEFDRLMNKHFPD